MRFDLTDLRVFMHACESGSMTEAAARSHLTLAAVSARMLALEDKMGVTLLRRHRRGVEPTHAGALLARHAGVVFHQLHALQKDLSPGTGPAARATVLLGNSSALGRPLSDIVAGVLAQHPSARITVRESGSEVTVHALQIGAADIGLISDAAVSEGLSAVDLGPDPLVLVAPAGHPLAGRSAVPFQAPLAHDWVGGSEGSALHTHLAMQAFKLGAAISYKTIMPSSDEVLDLVAQGLGIGVLPAALVDLARHPIAMVPLADDWARRRLLLCHQPGLDDPVALALAATVQAHWLSGPPRTTCPAAHALPR